MSLVAWYPLKDNINDYSGNGYHLTNTNTSSVVLDTTDGKLGSCYNFSGAGALKSNANVWKTFDTSKFTIAVWIKLTSANGVNQDGIPNNINGAIGIMSEGVSFSFMIRSQKPTLQVRDTREGYYWAYYTANTQLSINQWHHIALVVDGNNIKIYINGNLDKQFTLDATVVLPDNNTYFAAGCDFPGGDEYFIGKYNDIRVYDEALTTKEIRELYKTCIAHYSFNDPNSEPTTNLLPIDDENWRVTKKNYDTTYELISNSEAWIITGARFRFTEKTDPNFTGECWQVAYYRTKLKNFDTTKQYTLSFDAKLLNSSTTISVALRRANGAQAINTYNTYTTLNYQDYKEWKRFSVTFVPILSVTDDEIVIYITGTDAADFMIANPQLEIKDHATPFIVGSREEGIISDHSGFGNDMVISADTSLKWIKNSKLGKGCFEFDGTNKSYISSQINGVKNNIFKLKSFTIACWVYIHDFGTYRGIIEFATNSNNSRYWRLMTYDNSIRFNVSYHNTDSVYLHYNSGSIELNKWIFLTASFDNTTLTAKIYKDGVKVAESKFSSFNINYNLDGYLLIGSDSHFGDRYFDGLIDDIRIYANALTDEDVKSLYESRYVVDLNSKEFYCDEIDEVDNDSELPTNKFVLKKDGILKCKNIDEFNIYGMDYMILEDGSEWAKIFHHYNHGGTVLFTSDDEARNIQTKDKYSKLYLLEKFRGPNNKFEFLLRYPKDLTGYNRWKQSSNPTVATTPNNGVTGYEAVSISWNSQYWGGLEYNGQACLCDGSVNHVNTFYGIGYRQVWQNAIPGPSSAVSYVELWVRIDNVNLETNVIKYSKDNVFIGKVREF